MYYETRHKVLHNRLILISSLFVTHIETELCSTSTFGQINIISYCIKNNLRIALIILMALDFYINF